MLTFSLLPVNRGCHTSLADMTMVKTYFLVVGYNDVVTIELVKLMVVKVHSL